MDRKPKQMLESWLQESSYSNVMNSFETLRLSIDEPFDIRGITQGSSSITRIFGNNIQVRKIDFQKASNENRSHVLVSVLCNIEVARYMFTSKRIDLAISKSQTCNRHCLLNESTSIYMCMQIFKRIVPPNWVSQTCKVPQRSTTTTHDWEVFNDKKKPQRPSPMICVHTCS